MTLNWRSAVLIGVVVSMLGLGGGSARGADKNRITHGDGEWVDAREFRSLVKQARPGASGRAVSPDVKGTAGAWRCVVEVGPKTKGAGIVVLADQAGRGGFECLMGGTGEMRGFMLRAADGKVIWQDAWAPWMEYEPCVVETVVEPGRVRVQLLMVDGETLLSQSDWVKVDPALTTKPGLMGMVTDKGIARFWSGRIAEAPLATLTPDAPNKRRVVPDETWVVVGPMTWQWASADKKVVRQTANVDRAWLFNKRVTGKHRRWSCRVKVSRPSGGAGMIFQADGTSNSGLLCWLGGRYGDGCLMLYDRAKGYGGAIWSGPQGKWKYDTEYVLVGETRPGQVRVQLLAADGKTVVSESPWRTYDKAVTDCAGMMGFHTWKGPSAFWAFSEETQAAAGPGKPPAASGGALGSGWAASGSGWQWKDPHQRTQLAHAGKAEATAVNGAIEGIHGLWRCRVTPGDGSTATLLFQSSDDAKLGFAAALVVAKGKATLKLIDLGGKVRWYSRPIDHQSGTTYVLEGVSTTDRKRARLRAADGKALLADSDEVYVSDTHNTRPGHLGVRAAGEAVFSAWSFEPEK